MSKPHRSDPTPIEAHLETALEATEDDAAKYHLREAYQKCIVLNEKRIY